MAKKERFFDKTSYVQFKKITQALEMLHEPGLHGLGHFASLVECNGRVQWY